MRNLAQLETELGDYEQGLRGSIRIFANISAMVQYLPEDLSRFLTQHPLVRVDLEEAISPLIVRAVADGVAEIGIYGGNIPAPGLTVLPYRRDRLVVVVPARHPLRKHPSVRLDRGAALRPRGGAEGQLESTRSWSGRPPTSGQPGEAPDPDVGLRRGEPDGPRRARRSRSCRELVAQSYRASLKLAAVPLARAVGDPPPRRVRAGHGLVAAGRPAAGGAPHPHGRRRPVVANRDGRRSGSRRPLRGSPCYSPPGKPVGSEIRVTKPLPGAQEGAMSEGTFDL